MSITVRYIVQLEIEVPVQDGDDPRDYITQAEQSRVERSILRGWTLDGHLLDIEVIDTAIIDPGGDYCGDPREKGDDDGREYGDPRDAREERLR